MEESPQSCRTNSIAGVWSGPRSGIMWCGRSRRTATLPRTVLRTQTGARNTCRSPGRRSVRPSEDRVDSRTARAAAVAMNRRPVRAPLSV